MKKNLLLLGAIIICSTSFAQTKVVAHRGYWKTEGSCQNSITALEKAAAIGAYASEVDTWLTKDGVIVVNHDKTFKGVDMQTSDTEDILAVILDNGEPLPTLEQYLDKAKELGIFLVIEIKSSKEIEASRKIAELVKARDMEDKVGVIVWATLVGDEIIRLMPDTPVQYLSGDLTPAELKAKGYAGFDYNKSVVRENIEWIKEARELGLTSNVWTVNTEEDLQFFIDHKVDFITTDEPELLQKLIKARKTDAR